MYGMVSLVRTPDEQNEMQHIAYYAKKCQAFGIFQKQINKNFGT